MPRFEAFRQFQDIGISHLEEVCKGRGMFIVDMGLGKTPMASKVGADFKAWRWVVVCGENAIDVWTRNDPEDPGAVWIIEHFTGKKVEVHIMDDEVWNREFEWNRPTSPDMIQLYIVVYNTFSNDMGVGAIRKKGSKAKLRALQRIIWNKQGFDCLIVDEARRLRNKKSALFRACHQFLLAFDPTDKMLVLLLTGTPSSRGPQDLWTMFHLIARKKFRSYWNYINRWCDTIPNAWGGTEIVGPKASAMPEFRKLLSEHGIVIKETDPGIADQRPPLTRQLLPIKMDTDQSRLYKDFQKEMMSFAGDNLLYAQNSMVQFLRMRQILICPQILYPSLSPGQAIRDLTQNIRDEIVTRPTVIFTPFTAAFPFFRLYLKNTLQISDDEIIELEGGITHQQQAERIRRYRERQGIALVSIMYATAFSLEPATTCYFIGYHWDPNDNRQAEKRLHRLTTENPINAYYYTYKQTVDYGLCNVCNMKQEAIDMTIPDNLLNLVKETQ